MGWGMDWHWLGQQKRGHWADWEALKEGAADTVGPCYSDLPLVFTELGMVTLGKVDIYMLLKKHNGKRNNEKGCVLGGREGGRELAL